jgi:hypothetical protein
MECPSCKYPVPAEWSMCRRCGAPLKRDGEDPRLTLPAGLARRRSAAALATRAPGAPGSTSKAAAAAAALASRTSTPDTLLPGAIPRPDNLLPRATRSRSAAPVSASPSARTVGSARPGLSVRAGNRAGTIVGKHWRRILVLAIVGVALVMSLVAAWPVVFDGGPAPAASNVSAPARATSLLRTVVGGGRTLFASGHSFARVSPSALSARSFKVPIVASTQVARAGQVSMRITSASTLTLATPADGQRCVFARDEPAKAGTRFVTVRTADCRAAAAPATGWSSR